MVLTTVFGLAKSEAAYKEKLKRFLFYYITTAYANCAS